MLDAFWIVLLGMGIIFAVLGVLLGIMTVLSRLPENKKDKKAE